MTVAPGCYSRAVVASSRKPATYADIEALPEGVRGEIVAGELYASPRPRPLHARPALRLGADLDSPFGRDRGGPGGWVFLPEPELNLSGNVLIPDLAGWRIERWTAASDVVGIPIVPDWCCEILSPSTARLDRGAKMDAYARAGLPFLWLIDPAVRTLEAYRLESGWLRLGTWTDDGPVRAAPFDAVELPMTDWWM
ncbi:MAG: Uma2 family endonuclease [Deltaproteobacteria bacterium]|nr:Uma2 family endonuclease [Deltaproteobacteria bacterium]